jgi:exopolysaccharide biosynthesis protein
MTGARGAKPLEEIDRGALLAEIESGKVWQIFYFGPMLLDEEGHAMKKFNSDVNPVNPRSVIGYYEPGHYCFLVVDGRQPG